MDKYRDLSNSQAPARRVDRLQQILLTYADVCQSHRADLATIPESSLP